MADQSRSSLTSFVTGDLTHATLYMALVNLSVKEQRRFGTREIVEFSREKITDRPEATPFEILTVAEMCMSYPAILKDPQHDKDTIIAVEEAEKLFRRLGDQAGIDRAVNERLRLRARLDQAGLSDLSSLGGFAAPDQPDGHPGGRDLRHAGASRVRAGHGTGGRIHRAGPGIRR